MDRDIVSKHRKKTLKLLGDSLPLPRTPDEAQGNVEGLCALAGMAYAALHKMPYGDGVPSAMANAAYGGLEEYREQWERERN